MHAAERNTGGIWNRPACVIFLRLVSESPEQNRHPYFPFSFRSGAAELVYARSTLPWTLTRFEREGAAQKRALRRTPFSRGLDWLPPGDTCCPTKFTRFLRWHSVQPLIDFFFVCVLFWAPRKWGKVGKKKRFREMTVRFGQLILMRENSDRVGR